MQVLGTEINAEAEGVVVEFLGEGGEKIAVTMAVLQPRPTLDEAAPIARARDMMVQCSVFDNTEDRSRENSSNRDLGGPVLPARTECVFRLEYRDNDSVRQLQGVELASLEAAHGETPRPATDLLDDATEGGQEGWAVRIRDGSGETVSSIDFNAARREKAAAE
ncbi:hypothetical protein [Mesorhizobium sp. WSM4884]|uniref:DUF6894 family protein n=1 Tax=Mesorhizobium sp. WSM4884 TaxID=3038542 RepID=UPI00241715C2|nr:hypothetical protein [Mesorhizobium sp. WSM4884]MDG4882722.1 hypothetical protein [Mesorhizobium sp. WSM4884]